LHISLGRKKQKEKDIRYFEDALTSSFFGTLRYLPARIVVELFISILGSKPSVAGNALAKLSDDVIAQLEFWPNLAKSGRIEPDLRISLIDPSGNRTDLLIECKWKSGASSDFQLLDQWLALEPTDRSNTLHVYLVRDIRQGNKDRSDNLAKLSESGDTQMREWMNRLFVVSWLDLVKALPRLSTKVLDSYSARVVLEWQQDMNAMFERIGIREFGGFQHLVDQIPESNQLVFWKPFLGFQQFRQDEISDIHGTVFFGGNRVE
jgi:hypothetical protein